MGDTRGDVEIDGARVVLEAEELISLSSENTEIVSNEAIVLSSDSITLDAAQELLVTLNGDSVDLLNLLTRVIKLLEEAPTYSEILVRMAKLEAFMNKHHGADVMDDT